MGKINCMIIRATGELERCRKKVEQSKVVIDHIKIGGDKGYIWKPRYHLNHQVHEYKKILGIKIPISKKYNVFKEGATEDINPESEWITTQGRTHRELVSDAQIVTYRNMGKGVQKLERLITLITINMFLTGVLILFYVIPIIANRG